MKLVSMEKSGEEMKSCAPISCESDKYPYGLRLHLDHETAKKLGLKTIPGVKDKFYIEAMAEVCDVHAHDNGGEEKMSVGLQICEMGISKKLSKKEASDVLYEEANEPKGEM